PLADLLPQHLHRAPRPLLQPGRRRLARHPRSDLEGAALMPGYLARRLVHVVLVLIGISIITFLILHALPHDPARQVAGRTASPEQVEEVRHQLGLDRPLPVQYWRYAVNLVQGDLGRSYVQRSQVSELIAARLPATFVLMLGAIFCELAI